MEIRSRRRRRIGGRRRGRGHGLAAPLPRTPLKIGTACPSLEPRRTFAAAAAWWLCRRAPPSTLALRVPHLNLVGRFWTVAWQRRFRRFLKFFGVFRRFSPEIFVRVRHRFSLFFLDFRRFSQIFDFSPEKFRPRFFQFLRPPPPRPGPGGKGMVTRGPRRGGGHRIHLRIGLRSVRPHRRALLDLAAYSDCPCSLEHGRYAERALRKASRARRRAI